MIREQRLRAAIETSTQRVLEASTGGDDQRMFEALGECLIWVRALDDLLELRTDYKSRRNSDPQKQGQVLRGLRYACNVAVHGDPVVDVADVAAAVSLPDPPTLVIVTDIGGTPRPQIVGPPTRVQWTFHGTLPALGGPSATLEPHYRNQVAGKEVAVPIAA